MSPIYANFGLTIDTKLNGRAKKTEKDLQSTVLDYLILLPGLIFTGDTTSLLTSLDNFLNDNHITEFNKDISVDGSIKADMDATLGFTVSGPIYDVDQEKFQKKKDGTYKYSGTKVLINITSHVNVESVKDLQQKISDFAENYDPEQEASLAPLDLSDLTSSLITLSLYDDKNECTFKVSIKSLLFRALM